MNNTVCTLISVYERDKPEYLELALSSIISQTIGTDIFLVCDGQLTSDLYSVIDKYSAEDGFNLIQSEKNLGLANALNLGLEQIFNFDYQFIARMDADDICVENRLEKQVSFLQEHINVDVLGSAIIEFDGGDKKKLITYPSSHSELLSFFQKRDPVAHPSVMFRKVFFDKVGFYNTSLRKDQDTELWFRGFEKGIIFSNLLDPLLYFRADDKTIYKRRDFRRIRDFLKLRMTINKNLKFGVSAYIYTFFYCLLQLAPPFLTKLAYKYFR
jgi:glycosyltransferase involved in cell wall biosynthesis